MSAAGNRNVTILNVNDSEGARYVVTLMLRRAGYSVIEADTGTAALALAEQHLPDVVVLDVRLPDINGLEVCRRLRKNIKTASIKILHTSATFVTLSHKVESLQGGADGYLTQPFEQQELIATINSLVRLSRAERELRDYADLLQKADKRKDEFLAMLAHELRNPLSAISAAIPLLERNQQRDEVEHRAVEIMRRQLGHLSRLVDDLLDVSRVTQGKIRLKEERVDLSALLQRVLQVAQETKTTPRRQTLIVTLPERPVFVDGDITRLEQIFANLIDNASKYTDAGGRIEVTLEVRAGASSSMARVVVRDNGVGIAPEMISTIFHLFAQSEVSIARSSGGLGIGLTLVKTLIELHGGSILAHSDGLGRGSAFEAELPMSGNQSQESTLAAVAAEPSVVCRRILIVEDNFDVQQSLATLCQVWGHEVATASDGVTGLDRALQLLPDLCLIDIGLPVLDGYEVASRLRSDPNGRKLLLVALTGYGDPEQRARAIAAGYDLHIIKPVDAAQLRKLLQRDLQPAERPS